MGYGCGFQRNDTHSSAGETKCNNRLVSVVSLKRSSDSAGNCSADWETKLLCNSSSASPSPLQVPTKATNSRIFKAEKLREEGLSISRGQEELIWRANNLKLRNVRSLVNSKPQIILASDASMKDSGGGEVAARISGLGAMVKARNRRRLEKGAYRHIRAESSKIAILTFTKFFPQAKIINL